MDSKNEKTKAKYICFNPRILEKVPLKSKLIMKSTLT